MTVRNHPVNKQNYGKWSFGRCFSVLFLCFPPGGTSMKFSAKSIARGSVVAALYIALCFIFKPLSFGIVQFRISEVLCVLPIFMPEAVFGLFAGCIISNLSGGASVVLIDAILGSLTTLLAAYLTRRLYKRTKGLFISLLPPVGLNALIVGSYIPFLYSDPATASSMVLWSILSVAAGEAAVVFILGLPVAKAIEKTGVFSK